MHEIWNGDKDLVNNAVCLRVGGIKQCLHCMRNHSSLEAFCLFGFSLDSRSGDIKAINVKDTSSENMSGPLSVIISLLFEDGSIILLKIKTKNVGHSILQDLVQFKEGNETVCNRSHQIDP